MEDPDKNDNEASMEATSDAEESSDDSDSEQSTAASDGESSGDSPDNTDTEPDRKSAATASSGRESEGKPSSSGDESQRRAKKKSKKALKKKEEKARKKREAKQLKKDRRKERFTLPKMSSPKEIKTVSDDEVHLELANGYFKYIVPKTVEGYRYRPGPEDMPIIVEDSKIKPLQYSVITLCDKIMLKQREKERRRTEDGACNYRITQDKCAGANSAPANKPSYNVWPSPSTASEFWDNRGDLIQPPTPSIIRDEPQKETKKPLDPNDGAKPGCSRDSSVKKASHQMVAPRLNTSTKDGTIEAFFSRIPLKHNTPMFGQKTTKNAQTESLKKPIKTSVRTLSAGNVSGKSVRDKPLFNIDLSTNEVLSLDSNVTLTESRINLTPAATVSEPKLSSAIRQDNVAEKNLDACNVKLLEELDNNKTEYDWHRMPMGRREKKRRRRRHADSSSDSNESPINVNSLDEFPPLKMSDFDLSDVVSDTKMMNANDMHVCFQALNREINIPNEITTEFRTARESLKREARLRCQAAHVEAMATNNITPPWMLGIGKMPPWFPHSQAIIRDMMNLFQTNAREEMRAIAQWLSREAKIEGDSAVGHLKSLHHVAKKRGADFNELKENIAAFVGRARAKMSKTLTRSEVRYQREPPTVESFEQERLSPEEAKSPEKKSKPLTYYEPMMKKKAKKNLQVTLSRDDERSVSSDANQSDSEYDDQPRRNQRRGAERAGRTSGYRPRSRSSSTEDNRRPPNRRPRRTPSPPGNRTYDDFRRQQWHQDDYGENRDYDNQYFRRGRSNQPGRRGWSYRSRGRGAGRGRGTPQISQEQLNRALILALQKQEY